MARDYGKVLVAIWRDPDFRTLSRDAQRLYLFLISQHDLNAAGVIPMLLNRWANAAGDQTMDDLLRALHELTSEHYVVADPGAEELLVRSYVRNDEGWKSPNIMKSIATTARQVMSETLRSVIASEVARIDTSGLSTRINEKTGRSTQEFVQQVIDELLEALADCSQDPAVMAWNPFPNASVDPSAATGAIEPFPQGFSGGSATTTTPSPSHSPSNTPTPTTPRSRPTQTEDPHFAEFYELYPRKTGRGAARTAWAKAVRSADPNVIIAAVKRYRDDPNLPEKALIPHASTWLSGERWDDDPLPPRALDRATRPDPNQRVLDGLALAQRLADTAPTLPQIGQH